MAFTDAQERRSQRRADARRAILQAAETLLSEGGETSLSIRRVAERSGYTAPTIYHYFGDKTGLQDALLDAAFRKVLRAIRRVPLDADPAVTLRDRALAFARFGHRHPAHYRILTGPRDPGAQPIASAEEARELLEQPWHELIRQGRLAPERLEIAQRASFALLHGLITLRAHRPDLGWTEAQAGEALSALLHGLAAPARVAAPERDPR